MIAKVRRMHVICCFEFRSRNYVIRPPTTLVDAARFFDGPIVFETGLLLGSGQLCSNLLRRRLQA